MTRFVLDRFAFLHSSITAALALGVGLWAAPADAHIELTSPMARYSPDQQKAEPCGAPGNPPGAGPVATYQAGETITVQFEEFIDHPGHYRIALDPTGTDSFTSPTGFQDFYNSPEVLLDQIADMGGGTYSIDVTLPDEPCDPCTLQLIQVMNDGSWGPGLDDLYFQCADIVIEGSAATTTDSGTTGADDTNGDESSAGGDVGSGDSGGPDSGGPVGTEGTTGGGGSEGPGTSSGEGPTGTTNPDAEEGEDSGCGCRASASSPATAIPWLFVVLVAWRRRRG